MGNKTNKEIADIAPTLAGLEKQNPFRVPEGYFESLENRVLDSLDKKPILTASTPDGYFDKLSDSVMDRIKSEEKTKVVPLFSRKWISIAASIVIILGVGYLAIFQKSGTESESVEFALADIDPEEALDYLAENDNLYLSDLIDLDLYNEEDFDLENSDFSEMDDEELDQFLEELDPEDLEDLL